MRDHNHALAERGDVFHVVRREHDRHASFGLHRLEETVDGVLGNDVEADRGLVQKQHLRLVQERGDQFQLHPLAQREFADRLEHELAHAEQVDQFVPGAFEAGGLDPVDLLVEPEALGGGQVPPELVALAHHEGEPPPEVVGAFPGHVAEHAGGAPRGRDDPGEQLEKGRLAGAVGAQQRHELPAADREAHAAERLHESARAVKKASHAGQQALRLVVDAVFLGKRVDRDDGSAVGIDSPAPIGVVHGGSIGENLGVPSRRTFPAWRRPQ